MAKEISKTLVIGLGGTGQTVIRDIKKRMLRTYGEIPELVQFIEFDTDVPQDDGTPFEYYYDGKTYKDFKYRITEKEFLKIPSPGTDVVAKDKTCIQKFKIDELKKISGRIQGHGACGYRIMGRAHFVNAAQRIINRLTSTISILTNANKEAIERTKGYHVINNGTTVYVIASIAGGTGSSAFQDMSRMLQIAGINPDIDKIFGMFFLPKFFEDKPNTTNIFKNAYTALSELDYTIDLADPTRNHSAKELDNDLQDYIDNENNGKRVIYDSVFLIDSLTKNGNAHTLPEASNYVASFIASSIAANAQALTSSFVNSDHKLYNVDGKYQNYSGLGYCELRFNRQELVKYLLNKKLIEFMEEFSNGPENFSPYNLVDEFINNNQLNEGIMPENEGDEDTRAQLNQLIDSIINMNDRSLTGYTMAAVDTGREAATNIVTSKTAYLRQIGTITDEHIKNFALRKATLLQNLRDFLGDKMTGLGFGRFPEVAQDLKNTINDMKLGLEDEIEQHKTKYNSIEKQLQILSTTIAENSSKGWWKFGNKQEEQQSAINQYCSLVRFNTATVQKPTLAWLQVETTRKNEAVGVYDEMLKILDTYYREESIDTVDGPQVVIKGRYITVSGMYGSLRKTLLSENNTYKPSRAAKNETIYADAYFKDYFKANGGGQLNLNPYARNSLNDSFTSVLMNLPPQASDTIADLRNQLLGFFPDDQLIKRIATSNISFDELFLHCYGPYGNIIDSKDLEKNPQLKLLGQVRTLFDTLWNYHNFNGQGLPPEKNMVVGVYDTNNNIFQQGGYSETISGWNHYDYINLGDPDRIAFMLMETAIPAFKLTGVDTWANDFALNRMNTYTFSDMRMENIDMIMPGMNDEAEIAWAYGWMFGFICNPKNKRGLRVKPTIGYLNRNNAVAERGGTFDYFKKLAQSSDIAACHNKFVNDPDLSGDILKQVMDKIDHDPINSIKQLKKWVNNEQMWSSEVRGKNRESMNLEEQGVIQKELVYLQKCFTRLGEPYGLTLGDDGKITHYYNPTLDDNTEA